MASNEQKKSGNGKKVAIVGAGLVGALQGCLMAKNGYEVHLYEYRKDIRDQPHYNGRSVNLSMSVRGLTAMDELGLGEYLASEYAIPMYGRMIHNLDGSTYSIPYGNDGEAIHSVGRKFVNEFLLTAGEKFPNLHYHFEHKLTHLDLDSADLTFQKTDTDQVVTTSADFVVGCDGAFSNVRRSLMKRAGFNFSQEYIPHLYLELCIPPTKDGEFAIPANHLHIWPRGKFMMIALPNQDKSFTVSLFMPKDVFGQITNEDSLLDFFRQHYPDSIKMIGKEKLTRDYFRTKPNPLVSIKCSPYNWKDKCIILGDAAHAMVPFYGQGMNCGMEDVLILDSLLQEFGPQNRLKAFDEYSRLRNPDAEAMCDLAMYNYLELRDHVNSTSFLLRKKMDHLLHQFFPNWWIPLYTSVTFTRMRYHQCIKNREWQDQVLSRMTSCGSLVMGGLALWAAFRSKSLADMAAKCMEKAHEGLGDMVPRLQWQ